MADNPSPAHSDAAFFLTIGIAIVCIFGFWYLFHEQIITAIRWTRYYELWLIDRLVTDPQVKKFKDFLGYPYWPRGTVTWPHIAASSAVVGLYLRYPIGFILLGLAAWTVFKAPFSKFKTGYSLDKLIAAQATMWPVISPIIDFNPAEDNARDPNGVVPSDLPMFAEALSPEEWLTYYKIPLIEDGFDQDLAARNFAEQLGSRWRGIDRLPLHAKALFAAFALKAVRKRDEADQFLGRLAHAADPKNRFKFKPDLNLKRDIYRYIKDPNVGGEAIKIMNLHAFTTPALMRLLNHARERGGVLAPAQFLWLRGTHRELWYPLNNLGRQAFHPEAAGAIAHYQTELATGKPLLMPKVEAAVQALHDAIRAKYNSSTITDAA